MAEILRFFRDYEVWIYVLLGVLALLMVRRFILGWIELRGAAFGLERENAQAKINGASILFTLLLMLAVGEFVLVSFVVPLVPEAMPLPTPTLDLLATPTVTLPATTPGAQTTDAATTPVPTIAALPNSGCVAGQIEITEPKHGDTLSGVVTIRGSANIPNFGFYKYEVAHPGDTAWLSINAGEKIVTNDVLGEWATSVLPPGDYLLRLVVTDNQGVAMPACVIQVIVIASTPVP